MAREQVAQRVVTGALSVAANTIAKPVYVPKPCTISEVRIYTDHAPSGGTAHFRVMLNGVQISTLDILSGAFSGSTSGLAETGARGDKLTVDLISTPSGIGDDLNIEFVMGESGAIATDAQLRDRSTHGGTQTADTISDLLDGVYEALKDILLEAGNIAIDFDDMATKATISDAGSATAQGIIAFRTSDQALTSGGATVLSFQDDLYDTGQWSSGDPTKIIIPFTGWYVILGHVKVQTDVAIFGGSTRTLEILANGSMLASEIITPGNLSFYTVVSVQLAYLSLADYIQLRFTMSAAAGETAKSGVRNTFLTVLPIGAAFAGGGASITVQEADGTPSVADVTTLIVGNGDLTDNSDGSVRIKTAADATVGSSTDNKAVAAIVRRMG
jgi:hypothetical protein